MFRRKSKAKLRNDDSNQGNPNTNEPIPPPPPFSGPNPLDPTSSHPQASQSTVPSDFLRGPTDPVVLAWMPPTAPTATTTTNPNSEPETTPNVGPPPGYDVARVPVTSVKYQFSNLGPNCMLLLPPSDSPDTRPVYHIAVSMNCFLPYSFITTITRGGSADGELVGDFELSELVDRSLRKPTIYIKDKEYPMEKLISRTNFRPRWIWTPSWEEEARGGKKLFMWDCHTAWRDSYPCKLTVHPYTPLASFTPQTELRRRGLSRQLPTLEVTPEGHKYLDELVLSLLIVEAERLKKWVS